MASRGTSVLTIDGGILLDASGGQQHVSGGGSASNLKASGKPGAVKSTSMSRNSHPGQRPDERLPSAISGTSLAPLPDNDALPPGLFQLQGHSEPNGAHHARKRSIGVGGRGPQGPHLGPRSDELHRKPSLARDAHGSGHFVPELRAEGRALTLSFGGPQASQPSSHEYVSSSGASLGPAPAPSPMPLGPHGPRQSLSIQVNLTNWADINGMDGDSVCGTPPAITVDTVTKGNEFAFGALGPLTPIPLSPSLLTITGGFNALSTHDATGPWAPAHALPDMRHGVETCMSPPLPSPPVGSA